MDVVKSLDPVALKAITTPSNWRGAWVVLCQWSIVAGVFTVAALWPNPLTMITGTILLGGRQLGFFVLTHECGHRTLFRSSRLNEFVGSWLLSATDLTDNKAYMREHLEHHRSVGTSNDPDLANYADYPITTQRLRRKLKRDLTGRTGLRNWGRKLQALAELPNQPAEARNALLRGVTVNMTMLGIMTWAGAAWLYLMWVVALIFVNPAIVRVRQIAEHAAVPRLDHPDPRMNTRTLYASWLERLLVCPHQVNYHIEHHLLPSVPIYRLSALHRLLRRNGYYGDVEVRKGYLDLLKQVTQPIAVAL